MGEEPGPALSGRERHRELEMQGRVAHRETGSWPPNTSAHGPGRPLAQAPSSEQPRGRGSASVGWAQPAPLLPGPPGGSRGRVSPAGWQVVIAPMPGPLFLWAVTSGEQFLVSVVRAASSRIVGVLGAEPGGPRGGHCGSWAALSKPTPRLHLEGLAAGSPRPSFFS